MLTVGTTDVRGGGSGGFAPNAPSTGTSGVAHASATPVTASQTNDLHMHEDPRKFHTDDRNGRAEQKFVHSTGMGLAARTGQQRSHLVDRVRRRGLAVGAVPAHAREAQRDSAGIARRSLHPVERDLDHALGPHRYDAFALAQRERAE